LLSFSELAVSQTISLQTDPPGANVIALRGPRSDAADLGPAAALMALHAQWLNAIFASIERLDRSLAQFETGPAALPAGPAVSPLQRERTRLSCDLFQLRMAAVRSSSELARLRRLDAGVARLER
jgi:hypothetical protein